MMWNEIEDHINIIYICSGRQFEKCSAIRVDGCKISQEWINSVVNVTYLSDQIKIEVNNLYTKKYSKTSVK